MIDNLICWHNNKYVALKNVNVSILDFGFIHSDATYDVMKTNNREILFYDKHVARYENSCKYFGFNAIKNLDKIVQELLDINKINDAFVWVCNWRGTPPSGSPRDMTAPEHQVVYVKPYYSISDSAISLGIHRDNKRTPDISVPQNFKNFGWIELTQAQKYADAQGFDSAIVLDTDDNIAEGPGFGICIVKDGTVVTPASNVLNSVTISVVEDICNKISIPFVRTEITEMQLLTADEVFICSTSGGITPVNKIENIEKNTHIVTETLNRVFKESK